MTRVVRFGFGSDGRKSAWLFEHGVAALLLWTRHGDPWAPTFKCAVCGAGMGGSGSHAINGIITMWRPTGCHRCESREAQRATAKRRRENPRALAGVDVDRAIAELKRLPVFTEIGIDRARITVEVGHRSDRCCNGRAWTLQRRIRIVGGPEATPARVLEVVLHELCHVATPRAHHGERFRRVFARAVREAWGIEVPVFLDRGRHQNASYRMGAIATEQLTELIASGAVDTYPPEPGSAKRPREEITAALVEKRAAHAVKMLRKAERKLALAKTVRARWAKRVGYYERQAARRGSK